MSGPIPARPTGSPGAAELTPAASLAWKIAAGEANGGRHEFIEPAHFLIGILSLEKLVYDRPDGLRASERDLEVARAENRCLEALFRSLQLQPTELRRLLREALGPGRAAARSGGPISRSAALKAAFRRARALAGAAPASCLHFLAALAEQPDGALQRALQGRRAGAQDLQVRTLAFAEQLRAVETAAEGLARRAGVALRLSPEAGAFVAEQAFAAPSGAEALAAAVERLLGAPLAALAGSGKLARHAAWRYVYDEGGVYLLPD